MVYVDKFTLPVDKEEHIVHRIMYDNGGRYGYIDNAYPCGLFAEKGLRELNFDTVTVLYGGNGSGKSTVLNLIAQSLGLKRVAPFNTSETFGLYAAMCEYTFGRDEDGDTYRLPNGSRIITSDDIFDYMLNARANNDDISESKDAMREEYARMKFGETVRLSGLDDYEAVRMQVLARKKSLSRRKFLRNQVGQEIRMGSNGETALEYFERYLKNDTLYCLDEPENSLAPKMQMRLAELLEKTARYCGCQYVIATHSPFLLALANARIYNLDESPVAIRKWWELENPRAYYEFFTKHKKLFDGGE